MAQDGTAYDEVRYPAALYPTTHPDHLAALCRLHGLDSPDPARARVLEVAGGDGVNLIAMAAAHPEADYFSFDLSARAVERGQSLVQASGLGNIRIEVGDILDAAETMDETFDYVIVHGLYSWVPEIVREATLKLVGRVLSPNGAALISYNAQPGGYMRQAIRDMMRYQLAGMDDPAERLRHAQAILADFIQPREGDSAAMAGLRSVATPMSRKNEGSLFHDELGEAYAPQALHEVVAAAGQHGLAFLNDATPSVLYDGLPGEDMPDDRVVFIAQVDDYRSLTFFHQTVFVRQGRQPLRRFEPDCLRNLHAATSAQRTGETTFQLGEAEFEIEAGPLADFIEVLGQSTPDRLPLDRFAGSMDAYLAILRLFQRGVISLHAMPYSGVIVAGSHPRISGLARAQIELGLINLYTLDHRMVAFRDPGPRAFLALLDGTRDMARLADDWAASGHGEEATVEDALRQIAAAGMLMA